MRITGGNYRGRTIACPKGVIRPAMDRMRESLFSILGDIEDFSFLDLFSGSGCVGIEAASRGASPVVLVEKDFKKKPVVQKNMSFVEEDISLKMMSAEKYMSICSRRFDLIYMDPPFPMGGKIKLIERASAAGILEDDGTLMIHYPSEEKWPDTVGDFRVVDRRSYGRSILLFFRY
ncbi:MAG: 16S rRNA (guanine(966)-N(2))-methyltransferase RsmD [Spirochaetales bacterium]|uniref:16S rRNA (Guanine(966)-N(2))-methyltransferase RsmD n=1 Tax=Candidatus Thalassospirochaeta sargassi TaxID=3119039 RepID=A0AAJ1MNT4_9SPIO|nr:16S rRNA (guanine(966)-N(2))-methyltransferase RsmD [Spirochaetales bacterium]